jgi:hemin uptake protein HemP
MAIEDAAKLGAADTADATRAVTEPEGAEATDRTPRVVTSASLLAGATQLAILHDRTLYFLRQTRYGKLILTK